MNKYWTFRKYEILNITDEIKESVKRIREWYNYVYEGGYDVDIEAMNPEDVEDKESTFKSYLFLKLENIERQISQFEE